MNIQTKYNYKDTVYYLKDDKIMSGKIASVEFFQFEKEPVLITYGLYPKIEGDDYQEFYESKLFSTKQELINSLLNEETCVS